MGNQENYTYEPGEFIKIHNPSIQGNTLHVYVQNVGQGTVQLSNVLINDAKKDFAATPNNQLNEGNIADLTVAGTYDSNQGLTVKVFTSSGKFATAPLYANPTGTPTLTVTPTGSGSVAKNPDQAAYSSGSSVQLTANPQTGWTFNHWTGDLSGSTNPTSITMNGNKAVGAVFTQNEYTLSISNVGAGSGTVSKSPEHATHHYNDIIQLTSNAQIGSYFAGWSGDMTGTTNPQSITITGNMAVTATFNLKLTPTVPAPILNGTTVTLGDSVTASVTVSGSDGTPTGTVTFQYSTNGGSTWNTLGAVKTLSGSGQATSDPYNTTSVGTDYRIRVQYNGNTVYNSETSTATSLTVQTPQVTFVGAGAGASGTGDSLSVAYPSGLKSGDLLIMQVTVRHNSRESSQIPNGWTLLSGPNTSSSTVRQWIYYKFATGSETGSQSISFNTYASASYTKMARIYDFRNVALSTFTESSSFGSGSSTQITTQTVTTTSARELAVSFVFIADDNSVGPFTGMSGGTWTEPVSEFTTQDGSDGCIQLQTATMASAGTISGGTNTMSASDPWGVSAFALIPKQTL